MALSNNTSSSIRLLHWATKSIFYLYLEFLSMLTILISQIESISNKLKDDKDQYEMCCSEIESVKVWTLHLVTKTEIKFLTSFLDPYP